MATSADEHEPSTCRDGWQQTTLDASGGVRGPQVRFARAFVAKVASGSERAAVEGEVPQRLDWASIRFSRDALV